MADRIEEIGERARIYSDPHQGYRTERDVRYAEDTTYLLGRIEELSQRIEKLEEKYVSLYKGFEGTGSSMLERIKELEAKNKRLDALASSTSIFLDHFERGTGSTTALENVRGHLEGLGY